MSLNKFLSIVLVLVMGILMVAGCAAPRPRRRKQHLRRQKPQKRPQRRRRNGSTHRGSAREAGAPIKIGVSILFDDRWLASMREAMEAYGAAQEGVEVTFVDSKEDVAVQLGQVENFVTPGDGRHRADSSQYRRHRPHDPGGRRCGHPADLRQSQAG